MTLDRKLIDECVHCGFCLPACPTYQSSGREMDSPRGRIYLMKAHAEGRQPLSSALLHIDQCLGCLGCVTACPSGVRYDRLIEQARVEVASERRSPGERWLRDVLMAVLPHRRRLRALSAVLWLVRAVGVIGLLRRLRIWSRLPSGLRNLEELAPPLEAADLGRRLPRVVPAAGAVRHRVALLQGCVQSVFFSRVNQATARVLSAEGCDVLTLPELGCCGSLPLHIGRESQARRLAQRAIERLESERFDALLVNSAGCGSAMKHWSRLFDADPGWRARAEVLQAKVKDVSEWLAELSPVAERHPLRLSVAYHDACHLAHGQGVVEQPRALLRQIPGLRVVEIPEGDQCCGSAGVYNLLEPEAAGRIGQRKARNVASLQVDLLAAANPGCTLQIQRHLRELGTEQPARHPIELLDASIRGEAALELGGPSPSQ